MKMHSSITLDKVMEAAQSEMCGTENPGFCIACGAEHYECEPDAREYECDECGERKVFGAAELLMHMM